MSKEEIAKRYFLFCIGLILNSFGVAFVTKATLGTSPIASIPYSLSLIIPKLSLGEWTIIVSILLVTIQVILLKGKVVKFEIFLQIIISFAFGYCIDLSLMILNAFSPQNYVLRLLSLVVGCVIIAFGAYLEVVANVAMLPADAFVRAIAKITNKEYSGVRVISDISMSVIAALLCIIFLHKLSGVREGTVIAALITGNIVKIFDRKISFVRNFVNTGRKKEIDINS